MVRLLLLVRLVIDKCDVTSHGIPSQESKGLFGCPEIEIYGAGKEWITEKWT